MSDNLARTAVVEDCLNLMLASEHICEAFKEAGREHANFAQFGSFASPGDQIALQQLAKYRENWESHKSVKEEIGFRSAPLVPKTKAESVLAYVLGWLCHRAADSKLKPGSAEAGLYQDALLFHRLYVNEGQTPQAYRSPGAPLEQAATIGSKELAELFRELQQRFFIEMHTYVPDVDNIEGWFDKLHVQLKERSAYMDRFAEALMNPEPEKVQQHVDGTNFYSDEDAIIRLTLSIRQGAQPSQAEIEAAYAAEPKSRYAQALKQGYRNLLSANAFFTGSIDQGRLSEQLAV
ncbi:hypothetical protein [Paenibacillus cremeus]|uniref:Phospholipase C/D domain-containing protein n=1 Tax=Paenibacillus cremeus TaxID=2163881 RepID=A0A559KHY1_9BACL|nr:hypothetical protein [Paenibacillus cremeus]TVY11719.1 hypothetical protein FPZ49_00020 [Paenibacillus cremeus]